MSGSTERSWLSGTKNILEAFSRRSITSALVKSSSEITRNSALPESSEIWKCERNTFLILFKASEIEKLGWNHILGIIPAVTLTWNRSNSSCLHVHELPTAIGFSFFACCFRFRVCGTSDFFTLFPCTFVFAIASPVSEGRGEFTFHCEFDALLQQRLFMLN